MKEGEEQENKDLLISFFLIIEIILLSQTILICLPWEGNVYGSKKKTKNFPGDLALDYLLTDVRLGL